MGMLALKPTRGVTDSKIIRAWAELFPALPPLTCSISEGVFTFNVEDRNVMLIAINMPIPQPEIDEACEYSWMWKDALKEMAQQKAHVIVTSITEHAPQAAMDCSRIIAAVAKAGDPASIYWGNAGHVLEPAFFIDAVNSFESGLPVLLWVCLRITGDGPKGPFTLTTEGLENFGHRELEIINSRRGVGDLRMMCFSLIDYLLEKGPVLKDGHTFGADENERMKIEHTTSKFRKGAPVLRLHV